jgi:hypothetical protein
MITTLMDGDEWYKERKKKKTCCPVSGIYFFFAVLVRHFWAHDLDETIIMQRNLNLKLLFLVSMIVVNF